AAAGTASRAYQPSPRSDPRVSSCRQHPRPAGQFQLRRRPLLSSPMTRTDLVARLARLEQLFLGLAKERKAMKDAMHTHGCPMLRANGWKGTVVNDDGPVAFLARDVPDAVHRLAVVVDDVLPAAGFLVDRPADAVCEKPLRRQWGRAWADPWGPT